MQNTKLTKAIIDGDKKQLEEAYSQWKTNVRDYENVSRLYYSLRNFLGRNEVPSEYNPDSPEVKHAQNYLHQMMHQVLAHSGKELDVQFYLALNIVLHQKNWRSFLSDSDKRRTLAMAFFMYNPVDTGDIFQRICNVITEWTAAEFHPRLENYHRDIAETFFGSAWVSLNMEDVWGNARAKFDALENYRIPIIFDVRVTSAPVALPTDLPTGY